MQEWFDSFDVAVDDEFILSSILEILEEHEVVIVDEFQFAYGYLGWGIVGPLENFLHPGQTWG